MKNVKTRSVGGASTPTRRLAAKAMTTLMLCAFALGAAGCGQKRPLQLPAKRTAPASTAATPAVAPAASAASAAN